MHFSFFTLLALVIIASVFARPSRFAFEELTSVEDQPGLVWKRSNNPQELAMARLQALLGPEAFTELDSHGRLSNLQRLG